MHSAYAQVPVKPPGTPAGAPQPGSPEEAKREAENAKKEAADQPKLPSKESKQLELAEEYMNRDDYEKAVSIYQELARNMDMIPYIHKKYMLAMFKVGKASAQESYLKKISSKLPDIPQYKIDLALYYNGQKQADKANGIIKKLSAAIAKKPSDVETAAKYALVNQQADWSLVFFTTSRKALADPYMYTFEMVNVYKAQGRMSPMISELLSLSERDAGSIAQIENTLQNTLSKPAEFDTLEKVLIEKSQTYTTSPVYSELLLWLYIQQHDFNGAFIQAKALDRRTGADGNRLLDLARICVNNREYPAAVMVLEYVTKEYEKRPVYWGAMRMLVNAREEQVKSAYPVDPAAVRNLIKDYYALNARTDNRMAGLENLRNIALLYGTYLNKTDSAVSILQQILDYPRADRTLADKCRLDLGDMYILQNVYWEATLLYSQAEKNEKDSPLGYDAKLRNARLSYFKGEFELAQEHLDVLKLATSREIANDALQLSLMIEDNLAFDTTGKALQAYANTELLLFQHREAEALKALETMEKEFPKHSLTDEVLWLRARINRRIKHTDEAIANLDKIVKDHATDLYGDDAMFMEANIYEEEKGDKVKAMELYQQLLKQYPGSIFTAESRKRFRALRGDKLDVPPPAN